MMPTSDPAVDGVKLLALRDGFHDLDAPSGMTSLGYATWRDWRPYGQLLRVLVDLTGGRR